MSALSTTALVAAIATPMATIGFLAREYQLLALSVCAPFMPWLLATALLHSLLVQDKLGHLKRLSIVLGIGAFFMSYVGTFLTRSGVVSSVH